MTRIYPNDITLSQTHSLHSTDETGQFLIYKHDRTGSRADHLYDTWVVEDTKSGRIRDFETLKWAKASIVWKRDVVKTRPLFPESDRDPYIKLTKYPRGNK